MYALAGKAGYVTIANVRRANLGATHLNLMVALPPNSQDDVLVRRRPFLRVMTVDQLRLLLIVLQHR